MWGKAWLVLVFCVGLSVLFFLNISEWLTLFVILLNCHPLSSVENLFHLSLFAWRLHSIPHAIISVSTPPSPAQCAPSTPVHSQTFKYRRTHACAHTNAHGPFSSAILLECDWLITTQKAWLCWCQKQDRYPRPQGAQRRLMSLSFTTPHFFLSLSPSEPCTLLHMHIPTDTR